MIELKNRPNDVYQLKEELYVTMTKVIDEYYHSENKNFNHKDLYRYDNWKDDIIDKVVELLEEKGLIKEFHPNIVVHDNRGLLKEHEHYLVLENRESEIVTVFDPIGSVKIKIIKD